MLVILETVERFGDGQEVSGLISKSQDGLPLEAFFFGGGGG